MTKQAKSYSQNKEFWDLYKNEVLPCVKKFDNERKSCLCFAIIGTTFFFALGLLCSYWLVTLYPKGAELYFLILLIFIMAYSFYGATKKDFEYSIKEKIIPIVSRFFGEVKWKNGLDEPYELGKIYEQSCVIPFYTTVEYDDNFSGIYKDVAFEIVEAEFIKEDEWWRRYHPAVKVFKGVIVKFAMNKKFTSHTVIIPKFSSQVDTSPYLKHMKVEHVAFEKKYSVFTNDEADARLLITPLFLDRLKQIKLAFNVKKISCAFYQDLLLIAFSTDKDLFSIGSLVKPVDEPEQYYQMYEEIVSIIKLIDYFKLD